jgi:hypothetical protein
MLVGADEVIERMRDVPYWPILLKKSVLSDELQFAGPLVRRANDDVRDHIDFLLSDHGPSCSLRTGLQPRRQAKDVFREVFVAGRFSTFSTLAAQSGRHRRRDQCKLLAMQQTWESELPGFR